MCKSDRFEQDERGKRLVACEDRYANSLPMAQPIVPFPSVAIPLNTLLAYLLRLWHTGIIVESTNVMPVHLPKAPRLRKNMSWKNTRLSNSTKRLYDTAFGK